MPRVYVGNLAESVTRDELRALFSKIGKVAGALVITDKLTGKSRGFGFVEMKSPADTDKAVAQLNEFLWLGRRIRVDVARPREQLNE